MQWCFAYKIYDDVVDDGKITFNTWSACIHCSMEYGLVSKSLEFENLL